MYSNLEKSKSKKESWSANNTIHASANFKNVSIWTTVHYLSKGPKIQDRHCSNYLKNCTMALNKEICIFPSTIYSPTSLNKNNQIQSSVLIVREDLHMKQTKITVVTPTQGWDRAHVSAWI